MLDRDVHQSLFCSDQNLKGPNQRGGGGADLERLQKGSSNTAKIRRNSHPRIGAWQVPKIPKTDILHSSEVHYFMGQTCCVLGDHEQCFSRTIAILIPSIGWGTNMPLCITFIHNTGSETPLQIVFMSSCVVIKARGFWMDWEPSSGQAKADQKSAQ